jgi:Tfp pilus assembly protein PilN
MTALLGLLILWGILTTVLVVLLIYRGTLTMHEDDQLFLDEAESHMEKEQAEIMNRADRLGPFIRVFGAASGVLIVVIGGVWFYQALTMVQ